jgi:hypothetical protein
VATASSSSPSAAPAELSETAPKALSARAAVRIYAGARIAEITGLDVDDVRLSARKGQTVT